MDINEIKNLPDRIPTETLISMFQNVLDQFRNNKWLGKNDSNVISIDCC